MTTETVSTEWGLVIPAPAPWLNANRGMHWAERAETVKIWRDAAHIHARAMKLPKALGRIHILATLHFTENRKRDAHNYYPTLKACVDGLVDYGLIADDNDDHLDGPDIRVGERVLKRGVVVLTIRALEVTG
ncbi:MAG: hypothetical protein V4515_12635 [Chloroflexota bacterium]